jgi:hypothetical protein
MSEETKLALDDVQSVAQHCSDFLYMIRSV